MPDPSEPDPILSARQLAALFESIDDALTSGLEVCPVDRAAYLASIGAELAARLAATLEAAKR